MTQARALWVGSWGVAVGALVSHLTGTGLWILLAASTGLALWAYWATPGPSGKRSALEPTGPDPAETTFQIGNQALPHLRQGLNRDTAQHLADIIQRTAEVDAVAICDTQIVLGWAGKPCPQHQPGSPLSDTTRRTIRDRVTRILDTRELMGSYEECDLGTVVIAPLVSHGQSVGAIKLYIATHRVLPSRVVQHAEGIAQMLSLLMEVVEADRQRTLAADARLEALQAQIRPHFLFNVLNTIIAFSRTDPDRARDLLIELAAFFRRSLQHRGPTIPLRDEIEYVNTYLTLERARFGERLYYRVRVDPRALDVPVPILTLQPLVENAVVHGLSQREGPGTVSVTARLHNDRLVIYVSDNGVGIPRAKQYEIFEMGRGSGMGVGLSNVAERMMGLYGPQYHLKLRSREGGGTTVRLTIPLRGVEDATA
ncbi:MAG: histidine kinase [Firmicutes bacterium]|nr:histidine kinase [Bacillota bacterium]